MSYKSYKCDLIITCSSKFLHGWLYPYRDACGFSGIPSDICNTSLQCIMLLLLSYLQRNRTIMPTVLTSLSFALWFLLTQKPVLRVVLDISLEKSPSGNQKSSLQSPTTSLKEAKCFGLFALTLSSSTDDFHANGIGNINIGLHSVYEYTLLS